MEEKEFEYYLKVPGWLLKRKDLNCSEKLVYAELVYISRGEGKCSVSNSHLAEWLGLHPNTVLDVKKSLKELGFIDYVASSDGKKTEYTIFEVSDDSCMNGVHKKCVPTYTKNVEGVHKKCVPTYTKNVEATYSNYNSNYGRKLDMKYDKINHNKPYSTFNTKSNDFEDTRFPSEPQPQLHPDGGCYTLIGGEKVG